MQQYSQSQQQQYPQQRQQQYQYNFTEGQMRHYFFKPSKICTQLLLVGGVLFLLGQIIGGLGAAGALGSPLVILGLGLVAGGAALLFIHYTQRPSGEQYTGWVSERSQQLYKKAFERLHLHESECNLVIEVQGGISSLLQLTKKFPDKEIVVKRLPYGFRHYSINTSIYIFLTKDEIAIYSGYINALTQQERFEDAVRYYYKDIVAVSTSGPILISWDKAAEKEIQRQGMLVRISNGDVVGTDYATRIILRDREQKKPLQGVDEVVPALLHYLKDHNVSKIEANTISKNLL